MKSSYRLGVDFDNTVVEYDALLYREARQRGLIPSEMTTCKREIRDWIRRAPEGDREWQKLQALLYGVGIKDAAPASGVAEFFAACRRQAVEVFIVSHKTQYAALDERRIDLREAAVAWLQAHRLFEADGGVLSPDDVYFEPTRTDKIARIRRLGCTHFIDDLEETFLEPDFPSEVHKILYASHERSADLPDVQVAGSWQEIVKSLFHDEPGRQQRQ